jgi:hypothetical protein
MDKDLITKSPLLPLSVNGDDAQQVNDDSIRLNLSNNLYISEEI